ncbi:alpha/beta fold hydrolase [Phytohabitans houttuyneae]|nr:alpha/beta hydrolase [Phytohabitans houttuyneae]
MAATDLTVTGPGGVRLRVRHWPASGGVPFVLVHGLASNALMWDEVGSRLAAAGHPAYAPDARGHGASDDPPTGYDSATFAADLAAVHEQLGITRAVLAGHSWGGNVAVRFTAEHPARVAALALVDGGWIDPSAAFDSWEQCAQVMAAPRLASITVDTLRSYLRLSHPDWSAGAIEAAMENFTVSAGGAVTSRLTDERRMSIVRSMWEESPALWHPAVAVPVLLLPVLPDTGMPRRAADIRDWMIKITNAMPDATVAVREYVDADHDLPAQQPARLTSDLIDLARLAS